MFHRIRRRSAETLPKVGEIVSCRFPLEEVPERPGPKARPALVLSVSRASGQSAPAVIEVAYGTSQERAARGKWLRIRRLEDLLEAGLHKPTLFIFGKTARLPFTPSFFAFQNGADCRLGKVPEGLMQYLRTGLDTGVSSALNPERKVA